MILEIEEHNKLLADKRLKPLFERLKKEKFVEKFSGWTKEDYEKRNMKWIDVMLASSPKKGKEDELLSSLFDDENWVAQHKLDGERVTFHIGKKANRLFSRRVSKETGWLNEKSDLVPHLRDLDLSQFSGTVLDGEILHPSGNFKDIGSVLRSLPERAWNLQRETGFLFIVVFDVTHWKGFNIMHLPYSERLKLLSRFVYRNGIYRSPFIIPIITVYKGIMLKGEWKTKEAYLKYILENKGEGIIMKNLNAPYEVGVNENGNEYRSRNLVKVKDQDTWDVVICGYDDSLSLYEGKEIQEDGYWEYWVDQNDKIIPKSQVVNSSVMLKKGYKPVTKYYYRGWIGAVKFGVCVPFKKLSKLPEPLQDAKIKHLREGYHIVEIGQTSGMSDEIRKMLSENRDKYMFKVIEVQANGITSFETGALRHPRFVRMRPDKSPEQCTWEAHIRK